jgi:hypothetical protein
VSQAGRDDVVSQAGTDDVEGWLASDGAFVRMPAKVKPLAFFPHCSQLPTHWPDFLQYTAPFEPTQA